MLGQRAMFLVDYHGKELGFSSTRTSHSRVVLAFCWFVYRDSCYGRLAQLDIYFAGCTGYKLVISRALGIYGYILHSALGSLRARAFIRLSCACLRPYGREFTGSESTPTQKKLCLFAKLKCGAATRGSQTRPATELALD